MITYFESCNKCVHMNICKKLGIINDFAERCERSIEELKKYAGIDLSPVCDDFCDKNLLENVEKCACSTIHY